MGRDTEFATIERQIRQRSGPRGVVLAGAPGVGKTRLAQEVLNRLAARGQPTRWVVATGSSAQLPLGAFALAIGDPGNDPLQVLQRAADALLAAEGHGELVLTVDDAHLLDQVSASLVHQLVAQRQATVIVTVRTGASGPQAVESLWKDGYLDRIDLQELGYDDIGTLLATALGGPIHPRSASRLYELCAGNVLYLRHVVAGELAAGRLTKPDRYWTWDGKFSASPGLVDLLRDRLEDVSIGVRDLLDILALAGPLAEAILAQLVPKSVLEVAESDGLVRVADDQQRTVRLEHPLYGDVCAMTLGTLRARRLRGAIVTALAENRADSGTEVLRRAALSLQSDLPADAALLTAGAQTALQMGDYDLAKQLAEASIGAGGELEAKMTLSYALGFGLDPLGADRLLSDLADAAANDLHRLQATLPRAGHLFYVQGRTADAAALLTELRQRTQDAALQPLISALESSFLAMTGSADEGLELAEEAIANKVALPPLIEVCAHWAQATAATALGRTSLLTAANSDVHDRAKGSYESYLPRLGYAEQHLRALDHAGRVSEAVALVQRVCPPVRGTGLQALMIDVLTAYADLAAGRIRSAYETTAHCLPGLRGRDTSGWFYTSLMLHTFLGALSGDAAAARRTAEEMDAECHPGFAIVECDRMLAWAWVEAAEGAMSAALARIHEVAREAADRGHLGHEAYALGLAARFGDASAVGRMLELRELVDGPRVRAACQQTLGLSTRSGDLLIDAAGRFEAMGDLLSAADAAAQATTCYDAASERAAHQAAHARVERLRHACEGAVTPALEAVSRPLPLSRREREIVTLAAAGLSNREIAQRLVVSVRTVEGHLYRAGGKLGTADRRQFASIVKGT